MDKSIIFLKEGTEMGNCFRIKPGEMDISSPKGQYITKEEKTREIIHFLITAVFAIAPLLFRIKINRRIKSLKSKQ